MSLHRHSCESPASGATPLSWLERAIGVFDALLRTGTTCALYKHQATAFVPVDATPRPSQPQTPTAVSQLTPPSLPARTHIWLRVLGLGLILALQFGPLLWKGASKGASWRSVPAARLEVASDAR